MTIKVSAFIANDKIKANAIAKFAGKTVEELKRDLLHIEGAGKGLKKRCDNPKPRENVRHMTQELNIHRRIYAEIVTALNAR